ncbi:MAG TPA: anti-sigma factor antagonist [Aggregatilineales bacterium]|nr:anti-sigma factor antagonist [Aggregatilineales bacterium]
MAFDLQSEIVNGIARLTLTGELDAGAAPALITELQVLASRQPRRLVFLVQNLDYISSAGLRSILFARQKIGSDIYWIAPTEAVLDTLQLAGFDQVVKVRSTYDPSEIETIVS